MEPVLSDRKTDAKFVLMTSSAWPRKDDRPSTDGDNSAAATNAPAAKRPMASPNSFEAADEQTG